MVLLDCVASHNFISSNLISRCGLTREDTSSFVVEIGMVIRSNIRVNMSMISPQSARLKDSTSVFCLRFEWS